MLRPDEVSDTPDEELSVALKRCETFIDQQLHAKGTKGGVAIVDLPEGMERVAARVRAAYAAAGWWTDSAGMGRIRLERPRTNQQCIDHAVASGAKSLDLVVQPGEVLALPKGSTWQED